MERICPQPMTWHRVFQSLLEHAREQPCDPPAPPTPLILAGWAYSNDVEKRDRWNATEQWSIANGCSHLVQGLSGEDFYFTSAPTSYVVGPMGGPMYRAWDHEAKPRPDPQALAGHLLALRTQRHEIADAGLASVTRPLRFTGARGRRLLVQHDVGASPPWGGWKHFSCVEKERRTFTAFRKRMNGMIVPHEVDHIDFLGGAPELGAEIRGIE
jgi:hypothetical protein